MSLLDLTFMIYLNSRNIMTPLIKFHLFFFYKIHLLKTASMGLSVRRLHDVSNIYSVLVRIITNSLISPAFFMVNTSSWDFLITACQKITASKIKERKKTLLTFLIIFKQNRLSDHWVIVVFSLLHFDCRMNILCFLHLVCFELFKTSWISFFYNCFNLRSFHDMINLFLFVFSHLFLILCFIFIHTSLMYFIVWHFVIYICEKCCMNRLYLLNKGG